MKTKNEVIDNEIVISEKISILVRKNETEIRKLQEEISQLQKWAGEAIATVFFIPSNFLYNEIVEYEKIKQFVENQKVNLRLIKKCDEIVEGYSKQIDFRKTKIQFCESLINEYSLALQQLHETENQLSSLRKESEQFAVLEKHYLRLRELNSDVQELKTSFSAAQELESLENEIVKMQKKQKEEVEYFSQLEKLSEIYSEIPVDNSNTYKQEIEKLMKNLKNS